MTDRAPAPAIPDDVYASDLDKEVRVHLRGLSKDNADNVARHLVMAGRLMDSDPELAYAHARAAADRAGRIDMAREAAGLLAYDTGRYAEALRELRTVRRLNGSSEHLAVMADCERGLGRPERAIELARSPEADQLSAQARVELLIVVAGARHDLGEDSAVEASLIEAERIAPDATSRARIAEARNTLAGSSDSAPESSASREDDEVLVFDVVDEDENSR